MAKTNIFKIVALYVIAPLATLWAGIMLLFAGGYYSPEMPFAAYLTFWPAVVVGTALFVVWILNSRAVAEAAKAKNLIGTLKVLSKKMYLAIFITTVGFAAWTLLSLKVDIFNGFECNIPSCRLVFWPLGVTTAVVFTFFTEKLLEKIGRYEENENSQ